MVKESPQNEIIESAWRESQELDEEIDEPKEKISSPKWDKIKIKWNKRQKKHSYWS